MSKRTPHDELFKVVFGQPSHARAFLEAHLPRALHKGLRWETLALVPGSFVDEVLTTEHTDLLFSISRRGKGSLYLYVLLEHQSSIDPLMAYRLTTYMTRIWEKLLRSEPNRTRLPPVLPVVLHHGVSPWTAPVTMTATFEEHEALSDDLRARFPAFQFELVDLVPMAEENLGGTALGRLALSALKSAHTGRLLAQVPRWAHLIQEVREKDGPAMFRAVMRYFIRAETMPVDEPRLRATLEHLPEPLRRETMTFYEQIQEEGEIRGLIKAILRVLDRRGLVVPASVRERVTACEDIARLTEWLDKAVTAPSAEALFAE